MKYTFRQFLYLIFRLSIYLLIVYYLVLPFVVPVISYHSSKDVLNPDVKHQDLYIKTKDNERLNLWYIQAKNNKPTVIFCQGNGSNMSYSLDVMKYLSSLDYGVILFDYRGFGKSTGTPSEKGLYTDLNSVIKYLINTENVKPEDIILWGDSLGSNIVIEIASHNNYKGIILQGTSTSAREMAINSCKETDAGIFNPLAHKICYLMANNFIYLENYDNKSKISRIKSPILIMHAKNDKQVPVEMAFKLKKLNPKAQLYISDKGTHNSFYWVFNKVDEFIKYL